MEWSDRSRRHLFQKAANVEQSTAESSSLSKKGLDAFLPPGRMNQLFDCRCKDADRRATARLPPASAGLPRSLVVLPGNRASIRSPPSAPARVPSNKLDRGHRHEQRNAFVDRTLVPTVDFRMRWNRSDRRYRAVPFHQGDSIFMSFGIQSSIGGRRAQREQLRRPARRRLPAVE